MELIAALQTVKKFHHSVQQERTLVQRLAVQSVNLRAVHRDPEIFEEIFKSQAQHLLSRDLPALQFLPVAFIQTVIFLNILLRGRHSEMGKYPLDADPLCLIKIQKCSVHIKKKHLVFFHDLFSPVLYYLCCIFSYFWKSSDLTSPRFLSVCMQRGQEPLTPSV